MPLRFTPPILLDERPQVILEDEPFAPPQASETPTAPSAQTTAAFGEEVAERISVEIAALDTMLADLPVAAAQAAELGGLLLSDPNRYISIISDVEAQWDQDELLYPLLLEMRRDLELVLQRRSDTQEWEALALLNNDLVAHSKALREAGESWRKELQRRYDLGVAQELINTARRYSLNLPQAQRDGLRALANTLRLTARILDLTTWNRKQDWRAQRKQTLMLLLSVGERALVQGLIGIYSRIENEMLSPFLLVADDLARLAQNSGKLDQVFGKAFRPVVEQRRRYIEALAAMRSRADQQYQQRVQLLARDLEHRDAERTRDTLILVAQALDAAASGTLEGPWLDRLQRDIERQAAKTAVQKNKQPGG